MPRVSLPALLVLGLSSILGSGPARANPGEVFGLGSKSAALGGAVAARVDDFSAGYYNPAGLVNASKSVTLGALGAASNLTINQESYALSEPVGTVVGAVAPVPLGGSWKDRVKFGIALFVLPKTLVRVIAHLPDEPIYPYYDNRTQRLVVLPALAVRVLPQLAVGVGLNILGRLAGTVIAMDGPTRALEPRVDEQIPTVLKFNLGLSWQVADEHTVALVFRQAFSVPFSTLADTVVAGQPLSLNLSAEGLFIPDQLVAGYAWRGSDVTVSADVTWARWSAYPGPYVHVQSTLPLVGPLAGRTPVVPWSDTIGVRAGVEGAVGRFFLRGGYAFETSAVPAEQPGVTNLLDGPKHTFSVGIGIGIGPRLRLDLHAQAQLVGARTLHKIIAKPGEDPAPFDALRDEVTDNPNDPSTLGAQISNPGYPTIDSGGQVFSGGLTLELAL